MSARLSKSEYMHYWLQIDHDAPVPFVRIRNFLYYLTPTTDNDEINRKRETLLEKYSLPSRSVLILSGEII